MRSRDFTPTSHIAGAGELATSTGGADRFLAFSGADRILAFVREELQPWVAQRYLVSVNDSLFLGHSLGGLFATYVLLTEPSTFKFYGIGSPALCWANDMMCDLESQYGHTHGDLAARVFVSVGGYENPEGERNRMRWMSNEDRSEVALEEDDMVAKTERMVELLKGRRYPGLEIGFEILPGELRFTSPVLNLSRALRYLLDSPR